VTSALHRVNTQSRLIILCDSPQNLCRWLMVCFLGAELRIRCVAAVAQTAVASARASGCVLPEKHSRQGTSARAHTPRP